MKQKKGSESTGEEVIVTWTAAPDNGSPITGHEVLYYFKEGPESSKKPVLSVIEGDTTEYVLYASDISNGLISFYVKAINIKGTSEKSKETEIYSADPPTAPTGLKSRIKDDK